MPRDFVRFLPNQRVDLPDFVAIQTNARTDTRSSFLHLLFARNRTDTRVKKILGGFQCTEDGGGPSSIVEVNRGGATGFEILDTGAEDKGAFFGLDGPSVQNIDFTGRPASTYTIFVRFVQDQGELGARVFWNDNTQAEDVDSIDTRLIVSWDVRAETASPGSEWQRVADVVWNGVSISNGDITHRRRMFFEGDEDGGFAHEWGDGVNDRDADRGQHGVHDLYDFVHMVRRQFEEIMGGGQKYYEIPAINLADHIADSSDPHGPTLTQTSLTVTSDFTVEDGLGGTDMFRVTADEIYIGHLNAVDIFVGGNLSTMTLDVIGGGAWALANMDDFDWDSAGDPSADWEVRVGGGVRFEADAVLFGSTTMYFTSASGGMLFEAFAGDFSVLADDGNVDVTASTAMFLTANSGLMELIAGGAAGFRVESPSGDSDIDASGGDLFLRAFTNVEVTAGNDFVMDVDGGEVMRLDVDESWFGRGNLGEMEFEFATDFRIVDATPWYKPATNAWVGNIPNTPASTGLDAVWIMESLSKMPGVLRSMTGRQLAGWLDADDVEAGKVTVGNYYFSCSTAGVDGCEVFVPLAAFGVPNGALLDRIEVNGESFGTDGTIEVWLRRTTVNGGQVNTTLANDVDVAAAGPLIVVLSGINTVIDYDTYAYELHIESRNDGGVANSGRVYDAQVRWGMPAVIPKISADIDY